MSRSIHDDDLLAEGEEDLTHAMSRKTLTVIIAVIVVVASIGVLLLVFTVDEGGVTGVELTGPSRSEDTLTFAYTIKTERALATGPCTFTVLQNGTTLHTRTFNADNGGGSVSLHFREFVVGNGQYLFRLEYKGTRGQATYTIGSVEDRTDFIVNSISQSLADIFVPSQADVAAGLGEAHQGAIQWSAYFYSDSDHRFQTPGPPDSYITLQLYKNGFPDPTGSFNLSAYTHVFVTQTINVSLGPGSYTVEALYTNQWVRDDAPIKTLNASNGTFVQDRPYACIVGAPYHGNNANNYTVTADASCSHDDIGVTQYTWNFGDGTSDVTNGVIPTETHQYPRIVAARTYTGTVWVYDADSGEASERTFTVTTSAS